jgi:hypothetical protein
MNDPSIFTRGLTETLIEIYPTYEDFAADYVEVGLDDIPFKNADFLRTIYYLLMGEYANSEIMNLSLDMFRYRFFTKIMAYGPEFERQLGIQKELLAMGDEALQVSSKTVYNTARNPSQKPPTAETNPNEIGEILPYIDSQNTTNHVRSKLDAWAYLNSLLDHDLTREFIQRFDELFVVSLYGNSGIYYTPIDTTGGMTI